MISVKIKKSYLSFARYLVLAALFILFVGQLFIILPRYLTKLVPTTVSINQSGFDPSEVTVKQGTVVRFINNDTVDRWPASNFHPTHDLYSEFDPKKPVKPGESWDFVADKIGIWKFHDHLSPHSGGLLIVRDNSQISNMLAGIKRKLSFTLIGLRSKLFGVSSTETSIDSAEFVGKNQAEQFLDLQGIAKVQSPEAMWKFVLEAYRKDPGRTGRAHDLAHFAGGVIFDAKGFDGLSICTVDFAFGCYHGFLDKAFTKDLRELPKAEKACLIVGREGSGPNSSCIHGIGHGIASYYQVNDLDQSLVACDRLLNGRDYCYDGIFMEFAREAPQTFYKSDDPLFPCSKLDEKYGFSCARNQTSVMLERLHLNFSQIVQLCLASQQMSFKNGCFESLGFVAAHSGGVDTALTMCQSIPDITYQAGCITAAAGEVIFQDMPGWQQSSEKLCLSLPGEYKSACDKRVLQIIQEYGRNKESAVDLPFIKQGEDKDLYVASLMRRCYGRSNDDCYKKVAILMFNQFSLKESLNLFAKNESVKEIYARCHEVTHFLSREEMKQAKSIPDVFSVCDSTCHGGCYHGALEQYILDKKIQIGDSNIASEMKKICGKREGYKTPLIYNECLHGLGHAAMFVKDNDVPLSLKLCDVLDKTDQKDNCYSGVFMENSSSSTSTDHPGKYAKAEDPMYPCTILDEKYLSLCYRYQSSYFAIISHYDWSKITALCLKVPQRYRYGCIQTIGSNQVGATQDKKAMKDNCALMPTLEYKNICVQGIISAFAGRFPNDADRIVKFCGILNEENKTACYQQLRRSLDSWATSPSEVSVICRKINDPIHAEWCS